MELAIGMVLAISIGILIFGWRWQQRKAHQNRTELKRSANAVQVPWKYEAGRTRARMIAEDRGYGEDYGECFMEQERRTR